jgi:hypothetical protein
VASLSAQHSKSIGEIKLELANARSNFDISEAKVLELRNKLKDQMAEYSAKSEDFNKKHKDAVKVKKHIKKLFISFFYLPNPFHEISYRPPLHCAIHNLFFSSSTNNVELYFSDDEARWLEDKYFTMCDTKTKNRKNKEAAEKLKKKKS